MPSPRILWLPVIVMAALSACSAGAGGAHDGRSDAATDPAGADAAGADVLTDAEGADGADGDAEHSDADAAGDGHGDTDAVDVGEPPPDPGVRVRPAPPRILRDVARVDDAAAFTGPVIPPNRTTMDGRIAINVQGGAPELKLWLFVPERVEEPLLDGPPGTQILADVDPLILPFAPTEGFDSTGHAAICDPTGQFARPGERPNPYACGEGLADDCYDVVIVSNTVGGGGAQIWGVPLHVRVERPKTPEARIASAALGEPTAGAFLRGSPEWTEPAVTVDGRLLTGRFGERALTWTNPRTGEARTERYDIMYSVLPADAEPCDVTGWTAFHPISYAHHDPAMRGTYGLAAYPLRDGVGDPVPEGADIGGTYPWVDRNGRNLFLTGIGDTLARTPADVYPRRCVEDGCPDYEEAEGWQKGYAMVGLWTHGKLVHIDSLINHTDWPLGVDPQRHRMVRLYDAGDGEGPEEVRVGSGRVSRTDTAVPRGFGGNANIFDSIENLFQVHTPLRPGTPRDVVWLMSTGVATDEVVFDDWLDPETLIVSSMQAPLTRGHPNALNGMRYWNGLLDFLLTSDFSGDVRIQNAATSLPTSWLPPRFGRVVGGGRIEPVAMGGVRGKGFWLTGSNAIEYDVEPQPAPVDRTEWYIGLFVDLRGFGGAAATLARFPDGSELRASEPASLWLAPSSGAPVELVLPTEWTAGWVHLGFQLRDSNRHVEVFHDGFLLAELTLEQPVLLPTPGVLALGAADGHAGVVGWIDEFFVRAGAIDPEVACNHALGTLVGIGPEHQLAPQAARYGSAGHERVAAFVAAAGELTHPAYACVHDHTRDFRALHAIPDGAVPVRSAIIFPEGPLRFGAPRPDSSRNAFCRTCHHVAGLHGLGIAALVPLEGVGVEDDPRRQPMAPPRRVFGNIPADWIAPGRPAEALVAPPDGALVERWFLEHEDE